MSGRYLEDFAVGQTFGSGRLRVDEREVKRAKEEEGRRQIRRNQMSADGHLSR